MKVREKFTSVLALTLALSMLLSSAAFAAEVTGSEDTSAAGDSSYVEDVPADTADSPEAAEPTEPADSSEAEDPDAAEPEETTDPDAETPETADPETVLPEDAEPAEETTEDEEIGSPDLMATAAGWTAVESSGVVRYRYQYLDKDGTTVKTAGADATGENEYEVLLLPKQVVDLPDGTTKTFSKKYYLFHKGYWQDTLTPATTGLNEDKKECNATRYHNIIEIQLKDGKYQFLKTDSYRMLTVKGGIGTAYTGRFYAYAKDADGNITTTQDTNERARYEDGVGQGGTAGAYSLGTDKCLYFYKDGYYLREECKKAVTGWHKFDGKWYYSTAASLKSYKALLANKVFRIVKSKLYYYTNGKAALYTGTWTGSDKVKRTYEKGVTVKGWRPSKNNKKLYYFDDGCYTSTAAVKQLKANGGFHLYNKKWYYYNASVNKYYMVLANNVYSVVSKKLYKYTKGVRALFTGTYKGSYYSKGVKQNYNGWTKLSGKWYYFKKGSAVTGWHYLKRNGKTYKYFFKPDGVLVEDMYSYFGKSYLKKKMLVQVNRTTHTADILLWDAKKKSYCIAAKSFVASTPEKSSDFKVGTHHLRKSYQGRSWRRRWFEFTSPFSHKTYYYQYATFILGTNSWLHSPQYKKKNIRTLNVSNYNHLGTNQTYYCVRLHVVNVKLIYDSVGAVGLQNCKLYYSKNKGPYGVITLANSTGLQDKKKTYDPTDPAIKK